MLIHLLAQTSTTQPADPFQLWLILAAMIFGSVMAMVWVWQKLYKRTSPEIALVRTGMNGMKIVTDGGMMALPVVQEIQRISLITKTLEVRRTGNDALITKDPIRADVVVHFYIKVEKDKERIERAARSLGEKTMEVSSIQNLVDAKLVGALRSVAATATLQELHEDRQAFADTVEKEVANDLAHNGLTLESVSIVHLDQTDKDALNEDNVFDAPGLKLIVNRTENARREKNKILREAEVAIHRQDMEAVKLKLDLDREREFAEAEQARQVANQRAEQEADEAQFRAAQEEAVAQREIQKNEAVAAREIEKEKTVTAAEIGKNEAVQAREVVREQVIELANRDKEIQIAQKQQEVERQDAERLRAVAEKEQAEQDVITVEARAQAEREKEVTLINQVALSEKKMIDRQKSADAEAYEVERAAKARAEAAELQAAAIERLSKANFEKAAAEAAGNHKLVQAVNSKRNEVLLAEAFSTMVQQFPEIVREAMKPAEKISDIKVLNVSGGGNGGGNSGAGRVVSAFMEAGAAYPMFKEMLKFAGVDSDKFSLTDIIRRGMQASPEVKRFIEENIPAAVRKQLETKSENGTPKPSTEENSPPKPVVQAKPSAEKLAALKRAKQQHEGGGSDHFPSA